MSRLNLCCMVAVLAFLSLALFSCGGGEDVRLSPVPPAGREVVPLGITSSAFTHGGRIPTKYDGAGADVSPPLQWGNPPEGTRTFALVLDDPDAKGGTWIHWLIFNLPAETRGLPEAVTPAKGLPSGAVHGKNTWGKAAYGGPNPPGGTHHYYFRVYALDTALDLDPGIRSKELARAMKGHVLGYGELLGIYGD